MPQQSKYHPIKFKMDIIVDRRVLWELIKAVVDQEGGEWLYMVKLNGIIVSMDERPGCKTVMLELAFHSTWRQLSRFSIAPFLTRIVERLRSDYDAEVRGRIFYHHWHTKVPYGYRETSGTSIATSKVIPALIAENATS